MLIETAASRKDKNRYEMLEKNILNFKKNYKKSSYIGRIDYLLGLYYTRTKNIEKGKEIFNKILSNEGVSDNVKGLVRSELAILSIKEKSL